MKIDRLLSIVILLMNRRLIQAKELADRFEVSVRTIYRDIESINSAGIPVVTYQGANGGIGLLEGYRLDRSVLTDRELADIFTALKSISSCGAGEHAVLMEKISSVIPPAQSAAFQAKTSQVIVDFLPWDVQRQWEEKLAVVKKALEEDTVLSFEYVRADGSCSQRSVEPYTLLLKGQAWYLYAFCCLRREFRLFKLLRMKTLNPEPRQFVRQAVPPIPDTRWGEEWHKKVGSVPVLLRFGSEGRHLAEERFDSSDLLPDGNGGYLVTLEYPEDDWLYGFLLSFGTALEVVEPEHIRRKMHQLAASIADKYKS